jgi:selenocysteine-specific translation elongation factor
MQDSASPVAVPGLERRDLRRGDALVAPGTFPVSYRLDVVLHELEPIADRARLNVHHGTSHTVARVVRAGTRYAQLRLAAPLVAARGDRVCCRSQLDGWRRESCSIRHRLARSIPRLALLETGRCRRDRRGKRATRP